jgi:hypothetical protein
LLARAGETEAAASEHGADDEEEDEEDLRVSGETEGTGRKAVRSVMLLTSKLTTIVTGMEIWRFWRNMAWNWLCHDPSWQLWS